MLGTCFNFNGWKDLVAMMQCQIYYDKYKHVQLVFNIELGEPNIKQLLRCDLTSALHSFFFLRRLYVRIIQKTSGSDGSGTMSQARP